MCRWKALSATPTVLTVAAALILTGAAVLYAPIAVNTNQGPGVAVRAPLVLAVLILSAVSAWMLSIRPENQGARLATNLSSGFNVIWIFSFVGDPIVVAGLLAAVGATVRAPRRLVPILIALAAAGSVLGLIMFRLTEPPGEHIFG